MSMPTNGFDQRSPRRWIAKIETAIALARTSGGTARRITALIGDVPRKSARMQKKTRMKKTVGDGERKQATAIGAPIALPSAQMRSSPRTVSRSTDSGPCSAATLRRTLSAHLPPMAVASAPATTVITPKRKFATLSARP